uniref:ARAD1C08228p n=1 Tax=Blastobotrys adeninivorans TaxID=409370 RepID=A0A060T0I3_BLAAD
MTVNEVDAGPETYGSFSKLVDQHLDYTDGHVYAWKSSRTGLQVILVQKATPIVSGHFSVVTEIEDDSGAPHTLEHLVFMGSKQYPYKGLLDQAGNKLFSLTNAWTDVDETVYTLTSAGWEGFSALLPVYLDHVLHPTLTDEACLTEVYHIDGEGEEKGVVFSEMQGVENTASSLVSLRARQLMFPDTSGYSSETGGLMDKLRVLTNEEIAKFHKLRYTPENLAVMVSGPVEPAQLMEVMAQFDDKLAPSSSFDRPFSSIDPPMAKSIKETIEFADSDESMGELQLSWLGPRGVQDHVENLAVEMVGYYLTRTGLGKLQLAMVETQEPLAAEIAFYTNDFYRTVPNIYLYSVATEQLDEAVDMALKVIAEQVDKFDLPTMKDCLSRQRQSMVYQIERDGTHLVTSINQAFKYGSDKDYANQVSMQDFDILDTWAANDWTQFIKKYFVDNPYVAVLAKPSRKLYKKQLSEKAERVQHTREKYGKEGLEKIAKELQRAQELNDKPIPQEVLDLFAPPDPSNIDFINTIPAVAGLARQDDGDSNKVQKVVDADTDVPLFLQFEHFDSQFVGVRAMISSAMVDERLLPYLEVIFSELFTFPIKIDGTVMSFEQVVSEIKKDTIENKCSSDYQFEEYLTLRLKSSFENYPKIIEWMRRAMHCSIFDRERLQIIVEKHLNSLPEIKRAGTEVLHSSITKACFTDRSLKRAADPLVTEQFIRDVAEKLETDDGYDEVKKDLETIRSQMFHSGNLRIVVYGNIEKLQKPVSSWSILAGDDNAVEPITRTVQLQTKEGLEMSRAAHITPVPATESSFIAVMGKGPSDYRDPDIPALAVCLEYLQAVEGPFWRAIRGTGLAYGANIERIPEQGHLMFSIYRGSDGGRSIKVAKEIVDDLYSGNSEFQADLIKGAISSIVHMFAYRESNGYDAAVYSFVATVFKGLPSSYRRDFMKQIASVTEEDLRRVIARYVQPMFVADSSLVFAACNPSMVDALEQLLRDWGYNVHIDNAIEADSDSEDESDDEDDEEDDEMDESE